MQDKETRAPYPTWFAGPSLRKRWDNMANSTFYDRLHRGLIPEPEYPFGPGKPYWRGSVIEQFEAPQEREVA